MYKSSEIAISFIWKTLLENLQLTYMQWLLFDIAVCPTLDVVPYLEYCNSQPSGKLTE